MKAHFLSKTMEARSKWHNIFQVLKEKNSIAKSVSGENIKNEWGIKTFSEKGKLREFIVSKSTMKE